MEIKKKYDIIGWGMLFILIGILGFIPGDQWNIFFIGFGAIVLARNLTLYYAHNIAPEWFMVVIGAIVLIAGFVNEFNKQGFPLQLQFFSVVIVVAGIVMLFRGILSKSEHK
jgi:hypothetical protein